MNRVKRQKSYGGGSVHIICSRDREKKFKEMSARHIRNDLDPDDTIVATGQRQGTALTPK